MNHRDYAYFINSRGRQQVGGQSASRDPTTQQQVAHNPVDESKAAAQRRRLLMEGRTWC
jgi:hypothetical protein